MVNSLLSPHGEFGVAYPSGSSLMAGRLMKWFSSAPSGRTRAVDPFLTRFGVPAIDFRNYDSADEIFSGLNRFLAAVTASPLFEDRSCWEERFAFFWAILFSQGFSRKKWGEGSFFHFFFFYMGFLVLGARWIGFSSPHLPRVQNHVSLWILLTSFPPVCLLIPDRGSGMMSLDGMA